ncbi:MAG TPA: CPBP family intramembrane glutamic endopeptidase [Planctomycetota bacterium]
MAWILALGVPAATSVALAAGGIVAAIPAYHAACLVALAVDRRRVGARLTRPATRWTLVSIALLLGGLALALQLPRPGDIGTILRDRLFGGSESRFWFFAVYSMAVHCWAEELFWRGVVDSRSATANGIGFYLQHAIPIAIFLGSPLQGAVLSIPAGAAGLYWSWVSRRSRSLWPALASHAAADLAILGIVWMLAF